MDLVETVSIRLRGLDCGDQSKDDFLTVETSGFETVEIKALNQDHVKN